MSEATRKLDAILKPLGALVVIGVLFLAFAPDSIWHGGGVSPASERKAGGDITLPDIDGKHWSLAEQRGRVVLINYWATWCPPCREETPALVKIAIEYKTKSVEVAGITLDDDMAAVREFIANYRMPYPVLVPTNNASLAMMGEAIPMTLLYDRQGRLAKRYVGAVSESTFRRDIGSLLAEDSP